MRRFVIVLATVATAGLGLACDACSNGPTNGTVELREPPAVPADEGVPSRDIYKDEYQRAKEEITPDNMTEELNQIERLISGERKAMQ